MSTQSVDINISCSCLCVNLLSFILLSVSVCMHGIQYLQYRRYLPFCLILAAIFSTETPTIVARFKCKWCAKKGQSLDNLFILSTPRIQWFKIIMFRVALQCRIFASHFQTHPHRNPGWVRNLIVPGRGAELEPPEPHHPKIVAHSPMSIGWSSKAAEC